MSEINRVREAFEKVDRDATSSEDKMRKFLWLGHGHIGKYGDDGEMQCSECAMFGTIDYKRAPYNDVVLVAVAAIGKQLIDERERVVKLKAALVDLALVLEDEGKNARWVCKVCGQWTSANGASGGDPALIVHEPTCLLA